MTITFNPMLSYDEALQVYIKALKPSDLIVLMQTSSAAKVAIREHCQISFTYDQLKFLESMVSLKDLVDDPDRVVREGMKESVLGILNNMLETSLNPYDDCINIGDLTKLVEEVKGYFTELQAAKDNKAIKAVFQKLSKCGLKDAELAVADLVSRDVLRRTDISKLPLLHATENYKEELVQYNKGIKESPSPKSLSVSYQQDKKQAMHDREASMTKSPSDVDLIKGINEAICQAIDESLKKVIAKLMPKESTGSSWMLRLEPRKNKLKALETIMAACKKEMEEFPSYVIQYDEIIKNIMESLKGDELAKFKSALKSNQLKDLTKEIDKIIGAGLKKVSPDDDKERSRPGTPPSSRRSTS